MEKAHWNPYADSEFDASLYEQLASDANLTRQAEMDAALLRPTVWTPCGLASACS
ncbi:hypothetical protein [Micromonospora craterilacus]|uniref:hypothetical protein n=1 Tax=Micromonospora craterilacus TaxID=1655439 RepID=UPI001314297D|nr:hypothetical protein [Micromonospora craterilacus]